MFNIPFNVIRMLPISWPFGQLVCILVPLIQTSCVYVSTFTMTLIALHRLWTVRSFKRLTTLTPTSIPSLATPSSSLLPTTATTSRSTETSLLSTIFYCCTNCWCCCCYYCCFCKTSLSLTLFCIWLLALTLSLPHAAFNRVRNKFFHGRTLSRCMVQLPKVQFNFPLLLTVEVLITQYLLPLSITLVVYVKIARVIARQGRLICKLSDERKRRQSEAKRRRIFMLALVVATFATCWAPLHLYLFLVDSRIISLQTNTFIMVSTNIR